MSEQYSGEFRFDTAAQTALFKKTYDKLSEAQFNNANVLLSKIKKKTIEMGKDHTFALDISFAGGFGSSSNKNLPKANAAKYANATITAKKVYSVVEVDRETINTSKSDKQSFVRATKESVRKNNENYMRHSSRILFGDGTGTVGTISDGSDLATGVTASVVTPSALGVTLGVFTTAPATSYDVAVSEATWQESRLECRQLINVGTGSQDSVFEICEVDVETRRLVLNRIEGAAVPADSDVLFQQNSENSDPTGLAILENVVGDSAYGVPTGRRWSATTIDAGGNALDIPTLNLLCSRIEKKIGKSPTVGITSYEQLKRLIDLHEDQKRYPQSVTSKGMYNKKACFSFKGVEFATSTATIEVYADRHCPEDKFYMLNENHITMYKKPGMGWFDDDGTVFLRVSGKDCYEARYGGYWEIYIEPNYHGVITNLLV